MNQKFLRQWTMLQKVPRSPAKTTTRALLDYLSDKGYEVTQRTIQRDLKALAGVMPGLQSDGNTDIPGWSWARDSEILNIPSMDGNIALTFQLADLFLNNTFPPSVLEQLKPYFDSANNVLETVNNQGFSNWQNKVRILPRTQPLIPAHIEQKVITNIYEALFNGKQIRGRYIKRDDDHEVEYNIHPLGLIFRDSVIYLVATLWNYGNVLHLALHRFKNCTVLEEELSIPEGFDIDDYIERGSFEYGEVDNKTINLEAIFSDSAGVHILETPLSENQEVTENEDGSFLIKATVKDSAQLRWWLLGFGDYVEVLKPNSLREEFSQIAHNLHDCYN